MSASDGRQRSSSSAASPRVNSITSSAWLSLPNILGRGLAEADNNAKNTTGMMATGDDETVANLEPETGDEVLAESEELPPPPLPARPTPTSATAPASESTVAASPSTPLSTLSVPSIPVSGLTPQAGSLRLSRNPSRPQLRATPTTSLSRADVHAHAQSRGDAPSLQSSPSTKPVSRKQSSSRLGRLVGSSVSDGDDSGSIKSYIPALDARLDTESVLSHVAGDGAASEWQPRGTSDTVGDDPFETLSAADEELDEQMEHEFDELGSRESVTADDMLGSWKSKLKHFFILSASGKPIYSRHGDDQLISNYVGVAQTLISFYQDAKDPLKGFTAGDTRFVVLSKGPLNLVATSRLPESDAQLRSQLEALYMQILSTLTLPSMEKMFSHRPSTDLRRPLQGTDVLLDGLADGFTRGSPSSLLSALECLRLRKTHRKAINDTLLKVRSPNLLYGLIVAAGRLVSVVRPKKHSLHPGDLHLIFNMLFEAGSVKANGGENWIPLCLPGFNNTGFLYMYVSFFSTSEDSANTSPGERPTPTDDSSKPSEPPRNELAIVLISANREAFFELRQMRDDLISHLQASNFLSHITTAIHAGHRPCSSITPGTALRHFLYKSRANVQFTMPSLHPHFSTPFSRRRLLNVYHQLHDSIHSRTAHLKVQHLMSEGVTALAWETPLFELYCVAGSGAARDQLVAGANRVVQWIKREEERVFIIGGAVF